MNSRKILFNDIRNNIRYLIGADFAQGIDYLIYSFRCKKLLNIINNVVSKFEAKRQCLFIVGQPFNIFIKNRIKKLVKIK